jgi:hypothetical protein
MQTFSWVLTTVSEFYGECSSVYVAEALGNDAVLECECRKFPTPESSGGDATARMYIPLQ